MMDAYVRRYIFPCEISLQKFDWYHLDLEAWKFCSARNSKNHEQYVCKPLRCEPTLIYPNILMCTLCRPSSDLSWKSSFILDFIFFTSYLHAIFKSEHLTTRHPQWVRQHSFLEIDHEIFLCPRLSLAGVGHIAFCCDVMFVRGYVHMCIYQVGNQVQAYLQV